MKKIIAPLLSFFIVANAIGQYKVTFITREITRIKRDSVFISGTFNNWDSVANPKYKLQKNGNGEWEITLILPPGSHAYKYTGGNWFSVEKNQYAGEINDRKLTVTKDTTVRDSIMRWRDLFIAEEMKHLAEEINDTTRLSVLADVASAYSQNSDYYNADSALTYIQLTLHMLDKIKTSTALQSWNGYNGWLMYVYSINATLLHGLGNYPKSLELRLETLKLAEKENDKMVIIASLLQLLNDYNAMKDYPNVMAYNKKLETALAAADSAERGYVNFELQSYSQLATGYFNLGQLDSAQHFAKRLQQAGVKTNDPFALGMAPLLFGDIYAAKGNMDSAFYNYSISIPVAYKNYGFHFAARGEAGLAKIYQKRGLIDSALIHARQAFTILNANLPTVKAWGEAPSGYLAEITPLLASLYKEKQLPDSAYKYLRLSVDIKDSLYNLDRARQFQNFNFNDALRRQQEEQAVKEAKEKSEARIKIYALIGGIGMLLLLASILYRNNRQKQNANRLLSEQKDKIETTLLSLKSTQAQLIQAEKMASLGELTAGIAHEIQNPLNFVNNFSEVNTELLQEMKNEIEKGNYEEVRNISEDLIANEQKINHHGKRAESIVKGMLQHSRTGSGQKEPTDINQLANEYLQLTYHGIRAKDKSFNATIETDFDKNAGMAAIVPQDIGRVLLNLYNNAFYAVTDKKQQLAGRGNAASYEPTLNVRTKKTSGNIIITIKDNGNGIPESIKGKVFQPFFTTKPTGSGTGLGLSLAYDIVKAHGGTIDLHSTEGAGTEFTITLPA